MNEIDHIPVPKKCCDCKQKKNSVEFSRSANRHDGLNPVCKSCSAKSHQRRMKEDPDRMNRAYRTCKEDYLVNDMNVDESVMTRLKSRLETENKICKSCKLDLPLTNFYVRIRHGKHINIRPTCKKCHNRDTVSSSVNRPANVSLSRYKSNSIRRGLKYDIDLEFVKDAFSKPCSYCGEESILRTLDRVDSSIGYLKLNCVPCCIRCNPIKSDMPPAAWVYMAVGMKAAREAGAFGSWIGRNQFKVKKSISK